jgi:hypothetical protein
MLSVADHPRIDEFIDVLRSLERAYLGIAALDYAAEREDWPSALEPSRVLLDLERFVRLEYPLSISRIRMESPGLIDLAGKAIDLLRIAGRMRRRLGRYGDAEIEEKRAGAEDKRAHAEVQRQYARVLQLVADSGELDLYQRLAARTDDRYADQVMDALERRLRRLDQIIDRELITDVQVRAPVAPTITL